LQHLSALLCAYQRMQYGFEARSGLRFPEYQFAHAGAIKAPIASNEVRPEFLPDGGDGRSAWPCQRMRQVIDINDVRTQHLKLARGAGFS
jgi:hypothetical protein